MSIPPGARTVDPAAELAKLATGRSRLPAGEWPPLVDEVHQVVGTDGQRGIRIRVNAERPEPVPADLGTQIAKVVRANWPGPQRDGSADYSEAAQ